MEAPVHPKCGKTFPAGNRAGHCAACCETFSGLAAFEAHRIGEHGTEWRRCYLQPYEWMSDDGITRYGHWQDPRGLWHYGRKLTPEESAELVAKRKGNK